MPRHPDPYSWTTVRLPERDLAASILDLAAPMLDGLGSAPTLDDARNVLALAIAFWNASVLGSKCWPRPRVKELNDLRKRMRGRQAAPGDAATFNMLTDRWQTNRLDPRLVETWTYDVDETGARRLVCKMGLPDGMKAEVPPPIEKRVSIGGVFLDEVRIRKAANAYLSFPVDRHRGAVNDDGTATVYAMMPSVLQLFAEGRLTRLGGDPVDVVIGTRNLGTMVLTAIRYGGEDAWHDIAELVFSRRPQANR